MVTFLKTFKFKLSLTYPKILYYSITFQKSFTFDEIIFILNKQKKNTE